MATVTTTPGLFKLNWQDIFKGIKVAVILPVLNVIYQSIEAGSFEFDWKRISLLAAGGFIAYIIKNLLTPGEVVLKDVKPETVEGVKDGSIDVKLTTK